MRKGLRGRIEIRFVVQFTARKRDGVSGDRYRWTHGPYRTRALAEKHARAVRVVHGARVKVEVVPERRARE